MYKTLKRREKGAERIFEEIIEKSIPNWKNKVQDDCNCNRILRAGFTEVITEQISERNANHANIW